MLESIFDKGADLQTFPAKFAKFLRTFILRKSCKLQFLFLLTQKKVRGRNISKHIWYLLEFKIKKAVVNNKVRGIEQRLVLDLSSKTSLQVTSLQNCFSNDLSAPTCKIKRMFTNLHI